MSNGHEDTIGDGGGAKSSFPEVDLLLHVKIKILLRLIMIQTQALLEDIESTQTTVSVLSVTSAAPAHSFAYLR